jgi:hypothetical protein
MESKHTPGPWTPYWSGEKQYRILGPNNGHGYPGIAEVKGFIEFSAEENKSNAHLISAAPDMFEVIKELYDWAADTGVQGPIFPKLQAAYLKATGQPATTKA